jgi:ubiquinone/menaquinone biosynthesis C-methylase UbiE
VSEKETEREYDRWLRAGSVSGRGYAFLAGLQGSMLINTPVFQLDRELKLNPDSRLLDIGCGRGTLLQVLSSRAHLKRPPAGVDLSREMLRLARSDLQKNEVILPHLARASATRLPFASDSFDVATCSYLIKHLDDADLHRFLREVLRVLKPGGIAVVWEFAPTSSTRLNAWHRWLLTRGVSSCNLRSFTDLASAANAMGFDWIANAHLRPFIFPPIPRVSVVLGKTPEEWRERTGPGRARRAALEAASSAPSRGQGAP